MAYYDSDGKISIIPTAAKLTEKLPLGTYTVVQEQGSPIYYLEKAKDLHASEGLFGLKERAERVIETFRSRRASTGVLLSGVQGTGKTELARLISTMLREKHNTSTILINDGFRGPEFIQFITEIAEDCLIIIDEFEKNFSQKDQSQLLTLLSGVSTTKKLFILTANDRGDVSKYFTSRPGRIFYHFKMMGLSPEDIRWYVGEHLEIKEHAADLIEWAESKVVFTFDMIQAVVEEMNRYKEPIDKIKEIINIADMSDYSCYLGLLLDHGGVITCTQSVPLHSTPNQLNNRSIQFRVEVTESTDYEGKTVKLTEPRETLENHQIKHPQLIALKKSSKTYIYKSRDGKLIALLQTSLFGAKADSIDWQSRNLITDEQQQEVMDTLKNHPWYEDEQTMSTAVSTELNRVANATLEKAVRDIAKIPLTPTAI